MKKIAPTLFVAFAVSTSAMGQCVSNEATILSCVAKDDKNAVESVSICNDGDAVKASIGHISIRVPISGIEAYGQNTKQVNNAGIILSSGGARLDVYSAKMTITSASGSGLSRVVGVNVGAGPDFAFICSPLRGEIDNKIEDFIRKNSLQFKAMRLN